MGLNLCRTHENVASDRPDHFDYLLQSTRILWDHWRAAWVMQNSADEDADVYRAVSQACITTSAAPIGTRLYRSMMSWLNKRMQPLETALPML